MISNENQVVQTTSQKQLRMLLESKLSFDEHLHYIVSKVNKSIGPLTKLKNFLLRKLLFTNPSSLQTQKRSTNH